MLRGMCRRMREAPGGCAGGARVAGRLFRSWRDAGMPQGCAGGARCPRSCRGGCRDALSLSRRAGRRSGNTFLALLSELAALQPQWDILLPAGSLLGSRAPQDFSVQRVRGDFGVCPAALSTRLSVHSGFLTPPHPSGPEHKFLICPIIHPDRHKFFRTEEQSPLIPAKPLAGV